MSKIFYDAYYSGVANTDTLRRVWKVTWQVTFIYGFLRPESKPMTIYSIKFQIRRTIYATKNPEKRGARSKKRPKHHLSKSWPEKMASITCKTESRHNRPPLQVDLAQKRRFTVKCSFDIALVRAQVSYNGVKILLLVDDR
jgi:hypothetical protein